MIVVSWDLFIPCSSNDHPRDHSVPSRDTRVDYCERVRESVAVVTMGATHASQIEISLETR